MNRQREANSKDAAKHCAFAGVEPDTKVVHSSLANAEMLIT